MKRKYINGVTKCEVLITISRIFDREERQSRESMSQELTEYPIYPYIEKCLRCENLFSKICRPHRYCPNCSTSCRYGVNCNRANCYFNHPPYPQPQTNETDVNDKNGTDFEVTPLRKRSRDSSNSDYTTASATTTSSCSTNPSSPDEFSSPPAKKTKTDISKDRSTCPSSINVEQIKYTSKEQLSVNIIFAATRKENERVFANEKKRLPYQKAIENALKCSDDFNRAVRECKEIFVENMVHTNDDNRTYFSGHMRKFDRHKEIRIKCYTFHIFVDVTTKRKDFEYLDANVVESAEYMDIMICQDMLDEKDERIQYLCDEIDRLKEENLSYRAA